MKPSVIHVTAAAALVTLAALAPNSAVVAQRAEVAVPKVGVPKIHKEEKNRGAAGRPEWVTAAEQRARRHVDSAKAQAAVDNADTELALADAVDDEIGQTHVRFNQVKDGVPIFGRQIIVAVGRNSDHEIFGRADASARHVDTTPTISRADAILFATNALGHTGSFRTPPTADLMILPAEFGDAPSARLVFLVQLDIDDQTDATASHRYFVDAGDGSITWTYDALERASGYGQYSGAVSIPTTLAVLDDGKNLYRLWDKTRGGMYTTDMRGTTDASGATASSIWTGYLFSNATNTWGYSYPYREQTAVDAHFAVTRAWDYYRVKQGWLGLDGVGRGVVNRVHYGTGYANAFFAFGNVLTFGDGDGVTLGPTAAMDVVGHEYTHGVIDATARLTYWSQSGALNESLADVFGTAIEFYNGVRPDYLMLEDCYTPGVAGDAMRSMANPPQFGQPDHMSRYVSTTTDNGGVHTNSGIPNKAFYLLAQGGQHPYSKLWVTGIGRPAAEWIFFRAMRKLPSNASFSTARAATLSAAAEGYGLNSATWSSVRAAWDAVGVR